jgi:hypothetical protein
VIISFFFKQKIGGSLRPEILLPNRASALRQGKRARTAGALGSGREPVRAAHLSAPAKIPLNANFVCTMARIS